MNQTVSSNADFVTWVESLDTQKVRALASQSHITGWAVRPQEELVDLLTRSGYAEEIFEDNFG